MFTTNAPVTPTAHLNLDVTCPAPGAVRVAVTGEIDLSSSDVLRVRLLGALSALRPHHLEVDLAGVTFLDCGGLAVLVVLGRAALRTGCRLRITNPQPTVRRLLDLTGLLDVLTPSGDRTPPATTGTGVTASAGILVTA